MNLTNVLVAIEPATFEKGQERADVSAAVFHDFGVGVRIGLLDRLDQPLATGDGRHDQIEGNLQAPERAGDIGPGVLIVDMDDDRRLDAASTVGRLRRRGRLRRPTVEKLRVIGDEIAVDHDAKIFLVSWLNPVKRLRSAFGPTEKRENSWYLRYFFFLKKAMRRSRAHKEARGPSVST